MDHPVRGTLRRPDGSRWLPRLVALAAACAVAIIFMLLPPPSWWAGSGFGSDPGNFIRKHAIDYPLCAAWPAGSIAMPRLSTSHVESRTGLLNGADEGNFALLLPKSARVTAVYCASAAPSHPLSECSLTRCAPPVRALVEDNLYTHGRGIIFSFRNRTARADPSTHVGFWVVWR